MTVFDMTKLYVLDRDADTPIESTAYDAIYCLGASMAYSNGTKCLNDSERFNALALSLRDEYCHFIYAMNDAFIQCDLIHENRLSLYFISDLANKRTEHFDTFSAICHITLIKEKLGSKQLQSIILDGCSDAFVNSMRSQFSDVPVVCRGIKKKRSPRWLWYAKQAKYFGSALLNCLFLRFLKFHHQWGGGDDMYHAFFPGAFDEHFREQKYGENVSSQATYLISIIADGLHQNIGPISYIKKACMLNSMHKNVVLYDAYLHFTDVLTAIMRTFVFEWKRRGLMQHKHVFKGIDVSDYILYELDYSFLRIPRLLMLQPAIMRSFADRLPKQFIYYLHEYCYGRLLCYLLNAYFPEIETIGFQHGPAAQRKLLYFLASGEVDQGDKNYLQELPIPNRVLAEDEPSRNIYEQVGYNNVSIMQKIHRLHYLDNVKRNNVVNNSVLVAFVHDHEQFFFSIKGEIVANQQKTYYLKFHPRASTVVIEKTIQAMELANIVIAKKHITHYLAFVAEVIVTSSSVGYEAKLLGIAVRVINLPNKINESPLLDDPKSSSKVLEIRD